MSSSSNRSNRRGVLFLLLLLLMATTRNAETPPNFVPKTLQNRAQKVPNVPSETLEKKELLPAFVITVLSNTFYFLLLLLLLLLL